jgi:hypothetical protein
MADRGRRFERLRFETKMQDPHQVFQADEEETLVAPRFDDEETIVARRVVPLEEVGQAEPFATPTATLAHEYQPEQPATRRSWPLALVLVSALAGAVLGGTGLYLYQHRASSHANNKPAAQQPVAPSNAPAAASQPTPSPTLEVASGQPSAPATSQNSDAQTDESNASPNGGANVESPNDAAAAPEAEQRKADAVAGSPKHGKKGDHDEEIERNQRRTKHTDSDDQLSNADAEADGAPVARHVGTITIFDRPRRAERRDRTRQTSGTDRLRRIFEGQP